MLDRLRAVDYPGSNDARYSYDNVGNLTGMSNADVGVTYSYDDADQLTEVTTIVPGIASKSVGYTYDRVGNRETMTDPDGGVTRYSYDDADQLIRLDTPAVMNKDQGEQTTRYSHDDAGRLIRQDVHNGTVTLYTYDDADQLRNLTNQTSSGTLLSRFRYRYDKAGNRTRVIDTDGRTRYTYDRLSQLTNVTNSDGTTVGYAYDKASNRIVRTEASGNKIGYTYDAANRLLSVGKNTTYKWDNNGNLIGKNAAEGAGSTSYTYDAENRLTDITLPGDAGTNHFAYYPDGRRLSATTAAAQATYFFYDDFNVLVETNGSGATTTRYTSAEIDDWISLDRSGATHYYHQDGLGSIVGLTDASQTTAATYQYDAFGVITSEMGGIVNPYRFTGREYDVESGLYYYRARYYDADVGRFISQDLVRGNILFPATLHRYAYVVNNPVNLIDPSGQLGKFFRRLAKAAIGAAVGGVVGCGVGFAAGGLGGCIAVGAASAVESGARTFGTQNLTFTVSTVIYRVSFTPTPFRLFAEFGLPKREDFKPPPRDPTAPRGASLVVQAESAPAGGGIGNTGGIYGTGGGGPGPISGIDLVPVRNLCHTPSAFQLLVTIGNQGDTDAPASTTKIQFITGTSSLLPTPPIAAGGEVDLPPIGFSVSNFTITADSENQINEANEENNRADGECLIIP